MDQFIKMVESVCLKIKPKMQSADIKSSAPVEPGLLGSKNKAEIGRGHQMERL